MSVFRSGATEAVFDSPQHFPAIIETAEAWDQFGTFKRQLASRFQLTEFGSERLQDGSFILFPLEKKDPPKPKRSEFESFLQNHTVLSEFSPKSSELLELIETKKKYADSHDFLKYTRISMLRLVSQMIVLRKEVLKQNEFAGVLNERCIPISEMGDLERSSAKVNLREALDFTVQQALTVLGAQKVYDDLLAHWNEHVPTEEKQTRDSTGAAAFWVAQKEKFIEMTHHLRDWPEFGSTEALMSQPAKDSLLWYGKEALTDTTVKFHERQSAIKTAYHVSFKSQRKHVSLCEEAARESKRTKFEPRPPIPTAPKPTSQPPFPTLSAPRSFFSPGAQPKPKNSKRRFGRPPPRAFKDPIPTESKLSKNLNLPPDPHSFRRSPLSNHQNLLVTQFSSEILSTEASLGPFKAGNVNTDALAELVGIPPFVDEKTICQDAVAEARGHSLPWLHSPPPRSNCFNVRTPDQFTTEEAEAIDKDVTEGLENGTYREVQPSSVATCLARRPVWQQSKFRIIDNARPINIFMDPKECSVTYEDLRWARAVAGPFMSKIDLKKGYRQLRLAESAKPYFCFIWREKLYSFNVMAFGRLCPQSFYEIHESPCPSLAQTRNHLPYIP